MLLFLPSVRVRNKRLPLLIWHPAIAVPSYLRARSDMRVKPDCSLYFSRLLYDWYLQEHEAGRAVAPIIVDADDFITQPILLKDLALRLGLGANEIAYEWSALSEDEFNSMPERIKKMQKTLRASSGLSQEKGHRDVDVDSERTLWHTEFGEKHGEDLHKFVLAEKPDYEYLWAKRMTMASS